MFTVPGRITAVDVPDPVPGEAPNPEGATVTIDVEEPGSGVVTVKCFPEAAKQFRLGLCRVLVDAG